MFEPLDTLASLQVVKVKAVIVSVIVIIIKILEDIIIFVCPPADQSHGVN